MDIDVLGFIDNLSQSEINYLQTVKSHILFKHYVLRFDIPVHYALLMHVANSLQQLLQNDSASVTSEISPVVIHQHLVQSPVTI